MRAGVWLQPTRTVHTRIRMTMVLENGRKRVNLSGQKILISPKVMLALGERVWYVTPTNSLHSNQS